MKKIFLLITFITAQIITGQNPKNQEEVFQEFKTLYTTLLNFKDNTDFKKYGFAIDSPYNIWLKKVQRLKRNSNSKTLIKKGFVIGELETLGLEYANSKGKETETTKFFNDIFSKAISDKK